MREDCKEEYSEGRTMKRRTVREDCGEMDYKGEVCEGGLLWKMSLRRAVRERTGKED